MNEPGLTAKRDAARPRYKTLVDSDYYDEIVISLLLHNGEVLQHGNISVGLLSQTSATTVLAMWFAETEDTSAHLDEPQMADARLFTCTDAAARNCSLDPQSVSCHQADDVAVCDTSGNHLLQSALRNRSCLNLPQFVDGQLVERRHGKTSVKLARAAAQVQIAMRNLTLLSRIDFTTCTAQVTNLTCCYGCPCQRQAGSFPARSDLGPSCPPSRHFCCI
ncbi:hypothetical protein QR680_007583 [Steinernema hermaphroditum]|uniref:Phlebovirus glycoprotein G2 fusion domain-containing protein n=1 Tax=Steinernema hermaphroditum TaxID=289476 RepID=A0AA39IF71_9BILA|nr:hypothetical protein QR680_007583 [Steinernema hermaphroditum]